MEQYIWPTTINKFLLRFLLKITIETKWKNCEMEVELVDISPEDLPLYESMFCDPVHMVSETASC